MTDATGGRGGGPGAIGPPPSPPAGGARWGTGQAGSPGRRPGTTAVIAICALAAAALDGLQVSRPGYLLGRTADIGVYLGGAVRLVHGALPYRDFVFVQPPGITLLLSPAALLSDVAGTRGALTAVRLAAILVAVANVVLVGRLVRHRGPLLTLVACAVMAVYPAELYALNAGLLEPLVDLLCLLGAVTVFERGSLSSSARRWLIGGAAMGFATAVKLPALLPVLVLVLAALCLPAPRRRLLSYAAGVIAGFGIPSLPFILAAPGAFVRDVLLSQVGRTADRAPVAVRLGWMALNGADGAGAIAAAVLVLGVIAAGLAVHGRRKDGVEWFAIVAAALVAASQFVPDQYFPQYAALLAPFLAITLGVAVESLAVRAARPRFDLRAVALILVILFGASAAEVETTSVGDPAAAVDAVIPPGGCSISSAPIVLVVSDRFVSSTPGCTDLVDGFGTKLAYADEPGEGLAVYRAAITHADYLVLSYSAADWLTGTYAPLQAYVAADFHLVRSGSQWIYVRDGSPAA